ncbi:gliding motility protein GldM [Gilvibacter sp. SZ-19]|uniref:type IX secretion system motor protein PorM/GldM n=1 Tax=Gilvibacter sp. SZ-19 TaxID=754429 RepID=UPI000B3D2BDE|nr:gliding motility protein GldM [Gilvibacter sp. SZ-19]ARV12459.1 gliding motility protein GldM [Gilvibacter sp. SZ-19]
MAGGKLSPRQKMINLMYLVFIAMLALNISKEVLTAFGLLNNKLEQANVAATERNNSFMASLATKATDAPEQYAALKEKADRVSVVSDEFDSFIESIKTEMKSTVEDATDYEVMDKSDFLDQKFFNADGLKDDGQAFLAAVNKYRTEMDAVIGSDYPDIKEYVDENFATDQVTDRDGVKIDWMNYNFERVPMVASLTKLTQMQADIKTTKSELLNLFLSGVQGELLSMDKYNTFMDAPKSAYYVGETFDGEILLGRTDATTVPKREELTLDGRPLQRDRDYTIDGGRIKLKIGAGGAGDHKIEGKLIYGEDGKEIEVDVNTGFATITKPNSAVISADKMNVVYRGVDNPMTVSIPGIPDNNVSASGAGLSRVSGSKYVMKPGQGREVTITASGTLPDGQRISTPATFRIKDIPRPTGTVSGEDGNGGAVRMPRSSLEIASIGAELLDFDFDLKLAVTSFSFKVSGQPTVVVNGRKLDDRAKAALRRAKRGETVQIFDIKAQIQGNSSYRLQRISPVFVELTN